MKKRIKEKKRMKDKAKLEGRKKGNIGIKENERKTKRYH